MVRTHKKQRKTAFLFRGPLRLQAAVFSAVFSSTPYSYRFALYKIIMFQDV